MAGNKAGPSSREQELMSNIFSFRYDPLAYVMYAFPWKTRNTPLEKFDGPRKWQREEFQRIKVHLQENRERIEKGETPKVYYLAISSGRGIGKSAFLAMLSMWMMSCWPGGTNVVTANTETQLRSRTMSELSKWATMAINAHWFMKTSMALRPNNWYAELLQKQLSLDTQYYYAEAQPWSSENPDAFAGIHSQIATAVFFDEASGIDETIWNVTEGFFTDLAEFRIWVAISNPRRNTGSFFECFHKNANRWATRYIDSRSIEGVDRSVFDRIAEQYGEDSDVTRVECAGQFPRTGSNQFIGRELAQDAALREVSKDEGAPLLMGVDVARFGDDESVIRFRRGRDARTLEPMRFKGMDTMEFSSRVAEAIERYRPDAVFVDGGGVGGGVVDRLKQLGFRVIEVQSGERAEEREQYMNKRAEMWGRMKDWLATGCVDEGRLVMDMTAPEYDITLKGQLRLETKDSMKKRGLNSPDDADALALTFAEPIARNDVGKRRYFGNRSATIEYDVFSL